MIHRLLFVAVATLALSAPLAAEELSFDELMTKLAATGRLDTAITTLSNYRPIFGKITAAARALYPNAPAPTEIHIGMTSDINAHCVRGKLLILGGVIVQLFPTTDETAAIIAHETTHCLRDHHQARGWEAVCAQEYDADATGMRLMTAAGYDPRAMATTVEKMNKAMDGKYGSHACPDRLNRVRAQLAKAAQ